MKMNEFTEFLKDIDSGRFKVIGYNLSGDYYFTARNNILSENEAIVFAKERQRIEDEIEGKKVITRVFYVVNSKGKKIYSTVCRAANTIIIGEEQK